MFFYISKIFTILFFPFPLFVFLSIIAAWKLKKSAYRYVFIAATALIYLLSSNFISGALMRHLESAYPEKIPAEVENADAIVVLSGMINPLTGKRNPEFMSGVDRILAGVKLFRARKAPLIVISGGSGLILQRGESEALILKRWLIEQGIPEKNIIAEESSRNTAENAQSTAKIAQDRGWGRIILVTSAFHMPRSMGCFTKVGLNAVPYPVDYYVLDEFPGPEALFPTETGLSLSTTAIKEYIGIAAYRMRGYL